MRILRDLTANDKLVKTCGGSLIKSRAVIK